MDENLNNGKSASAVDTHCYTHGKTILDACCGARMFWFDKEHPDVLFADIRNESHDLTNGQHIDVKPDIVVDFRDMPFQDESFKMVVFDPPHLERLGASSDLAKKYGRLFPNWEDDIKQGFSECWRVLETGGTLIFKWNEVDVSVSRILKLIELEPLFGHKSGTQSKTHWVAFMKRQ